MEAFENAIMVHAAISGSTNSLLHIPAMAHELGLEIDADTFDRMHRGAHYLLDIRPAGKLARTIFLLRRRRPCRHGGNQIHAPSGCHDGHRKTLGENLEELKQNGFYEKCSVSLENGAEAYGRHTPFDNPIGSDGTVAILRGNLAPEGFPLKTLRRTCRNVSGSSFKARPLTVRRDAIAAVLSRKIRPRRCGLLYPLRRPAGSGMPEMFYTTEAISSDPELGRSIELDYRRQISGASKGPAIGHVSPEAADGGPIALCGRG